MISRRLIGPLLLASVSLTGCAVHEEVVVARPAPYYCYHETYYDYYGPTYYSGPIIVGGYYGGYRGGYYRHYR